MLHTPRQKRIFYTALFLLAGAVFAHAGGMGEDPIEQAEKQAEAQRYNEALQTLAAAVQEDPDRIFEAAQLIQRISQQREQYNNEWRRLIHSLSEEPDNSERALEIIDRMEEIDRFPNPRTSEQVRDARRTVRFRYNQTEFTEIMEEGAELLNRGEYIASLERYASGFDLFQEEFLEEGYGNLFENRVLGLAARLESVVAEKSTAIKALELAASELDQQVIDPESIGEVLDRLDPLLQNLQQERAAAVETALSLEEENERVPQLNEELAQDWYLVFLNRFALGRRDAEQPEGVAGGAARVYNDILGDLIARAREQAERMQLQALRAFDTSQWDLAEQRMTELREYAVRVYQLEEYFLNLHEQTGQLPDTERLVAQRGTSRNELSGMRYFADSLAVTAQRLQQFSDRAEIVGKDVDELSRDALTLQETAEIIGDRSEQIAGDSGYVEDLNQLLEERLSAWLGTVIAAQSDLYDAAARAQILPLRTAALLFEESAAEKRILIEGVGETVEQDDAEIEVERRYPQRALPELGALQTQAAGAASQVFGYREYLDAIPESAAEDPRIQGHIEEARELELRISAVQEAIAVLIADAEENIRLADEADSQGRTLIQQSRTALADRDVDRARDLLADADDRFFESLDYRYDEETRQEYQTITSALGDEIIQTQTIIVVEQVRERINQGRTLFQQDDFFAAEQVLLEAQDLWESINPGQTNTEVRNWLGLVRAALNLQTNREITENSPLYNSLVSYLNRARERYERGVEELESGSEQRGEELLAQAEENLNAVISAQPFNQEARVLQLRIQQKIDPQSFEDTFQARMEDAMARRETDPQTALVDLQDLAEIQPNYPGLDQAIYRLEITLGIRQTPVDRTAELQSSSLVQRAQQVAAGGTREQLQAAVGLLEEAIDIDPSNQDAIALLDQYRISLGGQVTTSISFEAQQQFRRAENLFVEGDLASAYSIVQQLLQSEPNQRYTPLINLQRRLESRLGI